MLKHSIILAIICIMLIGCQKNTCEELQKAVDLKIDQTNPQKYKMLVENCPDKSIREEVAHKQFIRGSFKPTPAVNW